MQRSILEIEQKERCSGSVERIRRCIINGFSLVVTGISRISAAPSTPAKKVGKVHERRTYGDFAGWMNAVMQNESSFQRGTGILQEKHRSHRGILLSIKGRTLIRLSQRNTDICYTIIVRIILKKTCTF